MILQTNILYLNDFDKFSKIFEILYYKNMEFSDVNFSKLIFLTNILYLNDFDKFSKIFEILYYENMEFSDVNFSKLILETIIFKFFKNHKFTSKIH